MNLQYGIKIFGDYLQELLSFRKLDLWSRSLRLELIREFKKMHLWYQFVVNHSWRVEVHCLVITN